MHRENIHLYSVVEMKMTVIYVSTHKVHRVIFWGLLQIQLMLNFSSES